MKFQLFKVLLIVKLSLYLGDLQLDAVGEDDFLLRTVVRAELFAVQAEVLVLRVQIDLEEHHVVHGLPSLIQSMVLRELFLLGAADEAKKFDPLILIQVLHLLGGEQGRAPYDEVGSVVLFLVALCVIDVHTIVLSCLEYTQEGVAVGAEALDFRAVLVDRRVRYDARYQCFH